MEDMETARVEQVTRAEEMAVVVTEAEEEATAAVATELGLRNSAWFAPYAYRSFRSRSEDANF